MDAPVREAPCPTDKLAGFLRSTYGADAVEEAARRADRRGTKQFPEMRELWTAVWELLKARPRAQNPR